LTHPFAASADHSRLPAPYPDLMAEAEKMAELAKGLDPVEYGSVSASDAKKQRQRCAGLLLEKLKSAGKK